MPKEREVIEELKKLTTKKDQDFMVPANYFLDHIAEDPEIMDKSIPLKGQDEFYSAILTPILQFYGKTTKIEKMFLVQIEKCQFIHGIALLSNPKMLSLYYFSDIQTGLAIVPSLTGVSNLFRLTAFFGDNKTGLKQPIIPSEFTKMEH